MGLENALRLVGKLSGVETRMFGMMTGRIKNSYPTIELGQLGTATFRFVNSHSHTKAVVKEGKLEFRINVRAKGFLVELTGAKANLSQSEIKSIEIATEKSLKNEMLKTIQHLQQLDSDILGLGELARATQPHIWRRIRWEEEYPKVSIHIKVDFNVEKLGEYR